MGKECPENMKAKLILQMILLRYLEMIEILPGCRVLLLQTWRSQSGWSTWVPNSLNLIWVKRVKHFTFINWGFRDIWKRVCTVANNVKEMSRVMFVLMWDLKNTSKLNVFMKSLILSSWMKHFDAFTLWQKSEVLITTNDPFP